MAITPLTPRLFRATLLSAALVVGSTALLAQDNGTRDRSRRQTAQEDTSGRRGGGSQDGQQRMLTSLRERLEITDDEEWKLISERITKVAELRRNTGGGFGGFMFGGRGPGGGDGRGGGDRGGTDASGGRGFPGGRGGGSPELSALQSALRDKLPDAEIKARLDRVRETRKQNEAKLAKAQEDLRAVLTVRQEAVLVSFGFLP